ncbi:MAG: hypothetical protein ACTSQJ_00355 [Promethearchaeota archaeon]
MDSAATKPFFHIKNGNIKFGPLASEHRKVGHGIDLIPLIIMGKVDPFVALTHIGSDIIYSELKKNANSIHSELKKAIDKIFYGDKNSK